MNVFGTLISAGDLSAYNYRYKQVCSSDIDTKLNPTPLSIHLHVSTTIVHPQLVLCWVDFSGRLSTAHIRPLTKQGNHVERSHPAHAFICFINSNEANYVYLKDIPLHHFICVFKLPDILYSGHFYLNINVGHSINHVYASVKWEPTYREESIIDSTKKVYERIHLQGFQIFYEQNVFDLHEDLLETLTIDLEEVRRLLPKTAACAQLVSNTYIYLNTSLIYGRGEEGYGCCYHATSGQTWLREHGMNELKAGCVELYSASDYLESRLLWGTGGLVLHELAHAYHDKMCAGGFECPVVIDAYQGAMCEGKYDCIPSVHGPQAQLIADGKKLKAYACTDCKEYFAELSVSFLSPVDRDESKSEFNKWYPHNRQQLQAHDPMAFDVLSELWGKADCK